MVRGIANKLLFKLSGLAILLGVAEFDWFTWSHLLFGNPALGGVVGFSLLAIISIPVTILGIVFGGLFLVS